MNKFIVGFMLILICAGCNVIQSRSEVPVDCLEQVNSRYCSYSIENPLQGKPVQFGGYKKIEVTGVASNAVSEADNSRQISLYMEEYNDRGQLTRVVFEANDDYSVELIFEYNERGMRTGYQEKIKDVYNIRFRIDYELIKGNSGTDWSTCLIEYANDIDPLGSTRMRTTKYYYNGGSLVAITMSESENKIRSNYKYAWFSAKNIYSKNGNDCEYQNAIVYATSRLYSYENGRIILACIQTIDNGYPKSETETSIVKYYYAPDNSLQYAIKHDSKLNPVERTIYTFNDEGRLLREDLYGSTPDGKLGGLKYSYKYKMY